MWTKDSKAVVQNSCFRSAVLKKPSGGFGMKISSFDKGPGVSIAAVTKGGVAEKGGLSSGDIIVAIDGMCVVNSKYDAVLAKLVAASTIRITVLKEPGRSAQGGAAPTDLVSRAVTLVPDGRGLGLRIAKSDDRMGVWVEEVVAGTAASKTDVRAGDLIVEVNGVFAIHKSLDEVMAMLRVPSVALVLMEVKEFEDLSMVSTTETIALGDMQREGKEGKGTAVATGLGTLSAESVA